MKQNRSFVILGVTGGAGSGKTTVIKYIQELTKTYFLHCDLIAHDLMEPGQVSYEALVKEFGECILEESETNKNDLQEKNKKQESGDGLRPISRPRLAAAAMATKESRERLNELTHPLVRQVIEAELERLTREQFCGVVVIEAALLIEAGYKEICDSLWYIYAPVEDRIQRMRENRGYSEEKIKHILAGQLTEEQFRATADVVIENPNKKNDEIEENLIVTVQRELGHLLSECERK